jgi:hypothetical protein
MDSLFEQSYGYSLNRAALYGRLAGELRLDFRFDVERDRHG